MAKYSYTSNSKGQNVKFIIVTALATLVILGIAVWAVVFVVSNSKQHAGTTEAEIAAKPAGGEIKAPEVVSTDDATDSSAKPEDATGAEGVSETNGGDKTNDGASNNSANTESTNQPNGTEQPNQTSQPATTNVDNASVPATGPVPDTGPSDFLPLAILAGALVTFGASKKLSEDRI